MNIQESNHIFSKIVYFPEKYQVQDSKPNKNTRSLFLLRGVNYSKKGLIEERKTTAKYEKYVCPSCTNLKQTRKISPTNICCLTTYQSQVLQVFHQECGSYSPGEDQHEKSQYQAAEIK